jgi:hypothetical protein
MEHSLYTLLGREKTLRLAVEGKASARVVPLRFGLAAVPITEALAAELARDQRVAEDPFLEFVYLTSSVAAFAKEASERGPVAYVESEDAGTSAWAAAVVWKEGKLILAPTKADAITPVNQALALLGARREADADETTCTRLLEALQAPEPAQG